MSAIQRASSLTRELDYEIERLGLIRLLRRVELDSRNSIRRSAAIRWASLTLPVANATIACNASSSAEANGFRLRVRARAETPGRSGIAGHATGRLSRAVNSIL